MEPLYTPAPSAAPAPADGARPVVLVADDYPENRRLLYFYLRDRYEVLQAATAEEALDMLRTQHIDLVVLDLNFCDGMSGMEAIGHIRQDPAIAHTRVLALTAYAYPDDRQRCLAAGFDAYLAKPVFKTGIQEKLAEMLGAAPSGDGSGSPIGNVWISRKREG